MSLIRRVPVRLAPVPTTARQRVTLGRLAVIAASTITDEEALEIKALP